MSSLEIQTSGVRGGNRSRIRMTGEVVVRVDYNGINDGFNVYFDSFTGQGPTFKKREKTIINIFADNGFTMFSGTAEQLCDILRNAKSPHLTAPETGHECRVSEPETDYFTPTGVYCISDCGGFEVEISKCGNMARMKDAYGSDNPQISDWKEIQYVTDPDDPDSEETIAVIDPEGFNIPLHLVFRS